ncbi:hypothetical protein NL676_028578 [Syzygium grande]|nr:hypothetical protein NL676_028578 [Syzygium grande]
MRADSVRRDLAVVTQATTRSSLTSPGNERDLLCRDPTTASLASPHQIRQGASPCEAARPRRRDPRQW